MGEWRLAAAFATRRPMAAVAAVMAVFAALPGAASGALQSERSAELPEAIKKSKVEVIKEEMGLQLKGLQKLRGKVRMAAETVRRTGPIHENRSFLLGEVLQLSDELPAALEAAPLQLQAAMEGLSGAGGAPAAAAPSPSAASPSAEPSPADENSIVQAAVEAEKRELVQRAEAVFQSVIANMSNISSLLRARVRALNEVRVADENVSTAIVEDVGAIKQQVSDQIIAMSQTRDKIIATNVEGESEDLHNDLDDLKQDLHHIKERMDGGKLDRLTKEGLDNIKSDMLRWKSKRRRVEGSVKEFQRIADVASKNR